MGHVISSFGLVTSPGIIGSYESSTAPKKGTGSTSTSMVPDNALKAHMVSLAELNVVFQVRRVRLKELEVLDPFTRRIPESSVNLP
jgi:hypothetical protein